MARMANVIAARQYLSGKKGKKAPAAPFGVGSVAPAGSYTLDDEPAALPGPVPAGQYTLDDAPAPEQEEPGYLESGLRGLKQGATLGFGDELTGAIESAFSNKTYAQARDEARAKDKAASEAHPWVYGGGELGGGIATMLVPGAGALASIKGAAALGAINAVGSSEATDTGQLAKDAAVGGALGGVGAWGIGKAAKALGNHFMGGSTTKAPESFADLVNSKPLHEYGSAVVNQAPERRVEGIVKDLAQDTLPTTKLRRIAANGDRIADVLNETPKLEKLIHRVNTGAERPQAVRDYIHPITQALTNDRPDLYRAIDKANGGGVSRQGLLQHLTQVRDSFGADPGAETMERTVDNIRARVAKSWGGKQTIPSIDLRRLVTDLQGKADASLGGLNATEAFAIKDERAGVVKQYLDKYLDDSARLSPNAHAAVGSIREINDKISGLLKIDRAMAEKAERLKARDLSTTLGSKLDGLANTGAVVGSIATGNPLPLVGKLAFSAANKAGVEAGYQANRFLATAFQAAQQGNATKLQTIIPQLIQSGVPTATIAALTQMAGKAAASDKPEEPQQVMQ